MAKKWHYFEVLGGLIDGIVGGVGAIGDAVVDGVDGIVDGVDAVGPGCDRPIFRVRLFLSRFAEKLDIWKSNWMLNLATF